MSKQKNILYLGLSAFCQTGGIEKVNKGWLKALSDIEDKDEIKIKAHVLLDKYPDERYIGKTNFKGFKGNKIRFMIAGLFAIFKADVLIVSHINLALLIVLSKIINPKASVYLHAHGIEVWQPLSFLQKWALKKINTILAVSEYTKQIIIKKHKLIANKISVLPNALDPFYDIPEVFLKPDFLLKRYQINPNQKVLFTLARLSSKEQYKGYEKVIKILPELIKTHPELIYLIGGKADEAEQKKLETLITSLNLESHVKLLGYISDQELTDHYLLADIFIMPSEGEGFGIAFIEAAACGCPVLGGNTDGSNQAIINEHTGLLCNPKDESDIHSKILELLSFDKTAKEIQDLALNNFGFNSYKQKIQMLLNH